MGVDVALLQETGRIPPDVAGRVEVDPNEPWLKHQFSIWPKIVKLSDRVKVEWFKQVDPISETKSDEIAVSGIGTMAAARVIPLNGGDPFAAASMYARWVRPHPSTGSKSRVGYSDGSAHRIISDLSAFIGSVDPSTHRILAAGDLNLAYGTLDNSWESLAVRERTVFDRMEALGLRYLGPQFPAGRRADPHRHTCRKILSTYRPSSRTGVPPPPLMSNSTTYSLLSGSTNTSTSVRRMKSTSGGLAITVAS